MRFLAHRMLLVLLTYHGAAACRYIALASMQRSGSSEFQDHLSQRLGVRNLGEYFSVAHSKEPIRSLQLGHGGPVIDAHERSAYPLRSLERERLARFNVSTEPKRMGNAAKAVVFKIFPMHLGDEAREQLYKGANSLGGDGMLTLEAIDTIIRSPDVCTIILERADVHAKWCSLQYAHARGDWSGHMDANGTHVHPPCVVRAPNIYIALHNAWYTWLRAHGSHTQHGPALELSFNFVVNNRSRAMDAVMRMTGLQA